MSGQDDINEKILRSLFSNIATDKSRTLSLSILKKPLQQRSSKEKKVLVDYTGTLDFFKIILEEQGEEKLAELCDQLTYYYLPAEEALFKEGISRTAYYTVFEGVVEIYANSPSNEESNKDKNGLSHVGDLGIGQTIGDTAFKENYSKAGGVRIIAKQECGCHLAVLENETYQRIVVNLQNDPEVQAEFLKKVPFFKDLNIAGRAIHQWVKYFEKAVYPKNHVIYKEGDSCEEIYLVRTGEVRCTKMVEIQDRTTNFLIDENKKLYPYESTLVTKQVELGLIGPNQIFGDEESFLLHYMRMKDEVRSHATPKTKGPPDEREILVMKIENLLFNELEAPNSSVLRKDKKEIIYRKNSPIKTEVTRESTMTVKSPQAEVWKLSARFFFVQIDSIAQAYELLIRKIEQVRRRREERLPNIADLNPNVNTSRGRRKCFLNSDEKFLSIIKHKKYGKQQYETVPVEEESFSQEKINDISNPDISPTKILSTENDEMTRIKILDTSGIEREYKQFGHGNSLSSKEVSISQREQNPSSGTKSLLLQKVKPSQEYIRRKKDSVLLIQGSFSHTGSPSSERQKNEKEDGKIIRISTKRTSLPIYDGDMSLDASIYSKTQGSSRKLPEVEKNQKEKKEISPIGKSNTPMRPKSLYDKDSPHCLFSREPDKILKNGKYIFQVKTKLPSRRLPSFNQNLQGRRENSITETSKAHLKNKSVDYEGSPDDIFVRDLYRNFQNPSNAITFMKQEPFSPRSTKILKSLFEKVRDKSPLPETNEQPINEQSGNIHTKKLKERVLKYSLISDTLYKTGKEVFGYGSPERTAKNRITVNLKPKSIPKTRLNLSKAMRITGFTKTQDTEQSFFFSNEDERLNTTMSLKMKPKFRGSSLGIH